jgi:hypothetical protein
MRMQCQRCQRCQRAFENRLECPDCGRRLVYANERSGSHDMSAFAGSDAFRWNQPIPNAVMSATSPTLRDKLVLIVSVLVAAAAGTMAYFARSAF